MSLVTHQEQAEPILSGPSESRDFPDWFRDQQRAAWQQFETLPNPTRKDQPWRFSNVGLLDLAPFKISPPLSEDDHKNILKYSCGLDEHAGRMIFANDQLIERDVVSDDLKKRGVIFQPLERAMVEHADLFRKYFMSTEAKLGSAKFAALHKAHVSTGTFLFVPRGLEIELPIEIFHWLRHDNMSVFPHLLLVADELAKVTVIEHFRSCDQRAAGFACGVNDLIAGPGAKVTYVCTQTWGENVIALQMNSTIVDHDASAMSLNLHVGAKYSRFESLSRLIGEGGRSDLLAVAVAKHQQEFDARTLQDHVSPRTASDLLYKNALDDRAPHDLRRPYPRRTARSFHRRLSKSSQPSLERRRRSQFNARPRNPSRQRPLHPRRNVWPDRRRRALLSSHPRHSHKSRPAPSRHWIPRRSDPTAQSPGDW